MEKRIFKRKIYDRLITWKQKTNGKRALLVQGARRIGKSTIVEEFAKNEYSSYLLIDFNKASTTVKSLFNDLMDLDFLFLQPNPISHQDSFYARESPLLLISPHFCLNQTSPHKEYYAHFFPLFEHDLSNNHLFH